MNTTKWELKENGDAMFGHEVLVDEDGAKIILHHGHDLDRARLISAAPTLLEALKGMLRWAQDCAVDTVTTRPNAIPECIAAKQAIAQAEGQ